MNGLNMAISKSCCPVYSFGTSSKINFGTNNKINNFGTSKKMDLNPGRLLNLPHLRITPPVAITPILKHRAYSCKDVKTGSIYEAPEVSGSVVPLPPYGLLSCLGIAGLALPKSISFSGGIQGVLKSDLFYPCIFVGVGAVFVARRFLWNIMCGFAVLRDKPFSIGDLIQVEDLQGKDLKGRVIGMGPITTLLVTSGNRYIPVRTCWFNKKAIENITRNGGMRMLKGTFSVLSDNGETVNQLMLEIEDSLRKLKSVSLDSFPPHLTMTNDVRQHYDITYRCLMKKMSDSELIQRRLIMIDKVEELVEKLQLKMLDGAPPTKVKQTADASP